MNVLAYLISVSVTASEQANAQNHVLLGMRTTKEGYEENLKRFSEILLNLKKEDTFGTLRKQLPFTWSLQERYDTTNPFGDLREDQHHALWTFNIPNDVLRYTNATRSSQISFDVLRNRVVSMADMELLGGSVAAPLDLAVDPEISYWEPQVHVDDRMRAFLHRLLRDFHHQWRHILRNDYNSVTLRVLSRAIIWLSTLDFEVRENSGGHSPWGVHVWTTQLPAWEPFESNIVRVGNIWIVICEDIRDGPSIVQQHIASLETGPTEPLSNTTSGQVHAHYIVLSVRHIMLCHITDRNSLNYTAPEPLFNGDYGTGSPSDLALDYLLWATTSARPSIPTIIQSLPTEIQDVIIRSSGLGTVSAAKTGCMLNCGCPFSWKHGDLIVTLEERYVTRPSGSSVESQIWFGKHQSGIFYLARTNDTC